MLHQLIERNRSYRRFDEQSRLSRQDLIALIDHARLSPSAMNRQPIRYRLVHQKEECDLVFPHTRWAGYLKDWSGPRVGERPSAWLLMCLPHDAGRMQFVDTGIAAQSILLAATEKGWGGCMLGSVDKDKVHQLFSLPQELEIVLVLALGVPAEKIVIETVQSGDSIEYWRDDQDVHHVPKYGIESLLIEEH